MRMLRVAFVVTVVAAAFGSSHVLAGNGYLLENGTTVKANEMPVCREILEILNLSENTSVVGFFQKPIEFPTDRNNFEQIQWTPISKEDAEEELGEAFVRQALDEEKRVAELNNWGGNIHEQLLFEKAKVNFDNTGNTITILRTRLENWEAWDCLLGKDAPDRYIKEVNWSLSGKPFGLGSVGEGCTPFIYGGGFYIAKNSGSRMIIHRPKALGYDGKNLKSKSQANLYNEDICAVHNPKAKEQYEALRVQQK